MSATVMCARCGHSSDWHRLDDSTNVSPTDPAAEFRCIGYDCTSPGPVPSGGRACDCHDMVRPTVVCPTCDGKGYVMTPDTVRRAFAAVMEHGRGAGVPHLLCPDCRSEVADREATS